VPPNATAQTLRRSFESAGLLRRRPVKAKRAFPTASECFNTLLQGTAVTLLKQSTFPLAFIP
jgi:hypothetical protein